MQPRLNQAGLDVGRTSALLIAGVALVFVTAGGATGGRSTRTHGAGRSSLAGIHKIGTWW